MKYAFECCMCGLKFERDSVAAQHFGRTDHDIRRVGSRQETRPDTEKAAWRNTGTGSGVPAKRAGRGGSR